MRSLILALLVAGGGGAALGQEPQKDAGSTRTAPRQQAHSRQQGRQQAPYYRRETWYEFALRQINPNNRDLGAWIERRRRVLLEARAANPYFWFSFGVTGVLMFLMVLYAKLWYDHRRSLWIAAEFLTDVHNHDQYSRQMAREAIEKYNRHIEACNRVIEAQDSGRPTPSSVELEDAKREITRLHSELDTKRTETTRLSAELQQKTAALADMSVRVDAMAQKLNGGRADEGSSSDAGLVARINRLEQELREERQKNRRLKGT